MATARQTRMREVGQAMQRYQRCVQAFDDAVGRRLKLGPADVRCLDWLADGPKSAGQLAAATGLKPAATTALIDRLAARRLVERVRDGPDRRLVKVRLTHEGAEQTGALYAPLVAEGRRLLQGLPERDLALIRDYLQMITDLTDRHREAVVHRPVR
jgi:DNA-binding MarR family transcriptional regulator